MGVLAAKNETSQQQCRPFDKACLPKGKYHLNLKQAVRGYPVSIRSETSVLSTPEYVSDVGYLSSSDTVLSEIARKRCSAVNSSDTKQGWTCDGNKCSAVVSKPVESDLFRGIVVEQNGPSCPHKHVGFQSRCPYKLTTVDRVEGDTKNGLILTDTSTSSNAREKSMSHRSAERLTQKQAKMCANIKKPCNAKVLVIESEIHKRRRKSQDSKLEKHQSIFQKLKPDAQRKSRSPSENGNLRIIIPCRSHSAISLIFSNENKNESHHGDQPTKSAADSQQRRGSPRGGVNQNRPSQNDKPLEVKATEQVKSSQAAVAGPRHPAPLTDKGREERNTPKATIQVKYGKPAVWQKPSRPASTVFVKKALLKCIADSPAMEEPSQHFANKTSETNKMAHKNQGALKPTNVSMKSRCINSSSPTEVQDHMSSEPIRKTCAFSPSPDSRPHPRQRHIDGRLADDQSSDVFRGMVKNAAHVRSHSLTSDSEKMNQEKNAVVLQPCQSVKNKQTSFVDECKARDLLHQKVFKSEVDKGKSTKVNQEEINKETPDMKNGRNKTISGQATSSVKDNDTLPHSSNAGVVNVRMHSSSMFPFPKQPLETPSKGVTASTRAVKENAVVRDVQPLTVEKCAQQNEEMLKGNETIVKDAVDTKKHNQTCDAKERQCPQQPTSYDIATKPGASSLPSNLPLLNIKDSSVPLNSTGGCSGTGDKPEVDDTLRTTQTECASSNVLQSGQQDKSSTKIPHFEQEKHESKSPRQELKNKPVEIATNDVNKARNSPEKRTDTPNSGQTDETDAATISEISSSVDGKLKSELNDLVQSVLHFLKEEKKELNSCVPVFRKFPSSEMHYRALSAQSNFSFDLQQSTPSLISSELSDITQSQSLSSLKIHHSAPTTPSLPPFRTQEATSNKLQPCEELNKSKITSRQSPEKLTKTIEKQALNVGCSLTTTSTRCSSLQNEAQGSSAKSTMPNRLPVSKNVDIVNDATTVDMFSGKKNKNLPDQRDSPCSCLVESPRGSARKTKKSTAIRRVNSPNGKCSTEASICQNPLVSPLNLNNFEKSQSNDKLATEVLPHQATEIHKQQCSDPNKRDSPLPEKEQKNRCSLPYNRLKERKKRPGSQGSEIYMTGSDTSIVPSKRMFQASSVHRFLPERFVINPSHNELDINREKEKISCRCAAIHSILTDLKHHILLDRISQFKYGSSSTYPSPSNLSGDVRSSFDTFAASSSSPLGTLRSMNSRLDRQHSPIMKYKTHDKAHESGSITDGSSGSAADVAQSVNLIAAIIKKNAINPREVLRALGFKDDQIKIANDGVDTKKGRVDQRSFIESYCHQLIQEWRKSQYGVKKAKVITSGNDDRLLDDVDASQKLSVRSIEFPSPPKHRSKASKKEDPKMNVVYKPAKDVSTDRDLECKVLGKDKNAKPDLPGPKTLTITDLSSDDFVDRYAGPNDDKRESLDVNSAKLKSLSSKFRSMTTRDLLEFALNHRNEDIINKLIVREVYDRASRKQADGAANPQLRDGALQLFFLLSGRSINSKSESLESILCHKEKTKDSSLAVQSNIKDSPMNATLTAWKEDSKCPSPDQYSLMKAEFKERVKENQRIINQWSFSSFREIKAEQSLHRAETPKIKFSTLNRPLTKQVSPKKNDSTQTENSDTSGDKISELKKNYFKSFMLSSTSPCAFDLSKDSKHSARESVVKPYAAIDNAPIKANNGPMATFTYPVIKMSNTKNVNTEGVAVCYLRASAADRTKEVKIRDPKLDRESLKGDSSLSESVKGDLSERSSPIERSTDSSPRMCSERRCLQRNVGLLRSGADHTAYSFESGEKQTPKRLSRSNVWDESKTSLVQKSRLKDRVVKTPNNFDKSSPIVTSLHSPLMSYPLPTIHERIDAQTLTTPIGSLMWTVSGNEKPSKIDCGVGQDYIKTYVDAYANTDTNYSPATDNSFSLEVTNEIPSENKDSSLKLTMISTASLIGGELDTTYEANEIKDEKVDQIRSITESVMTDSRNQEIVPIIVEPHEEVIATIDDKTKLTDQKETSVVSTISGSTFSKKNSVPTVHARSTVTKASACGPIKREVQSSRQSSVRSSGKANVNIKQKETEAEKLSREKRRKIHTDMIPMVKISKEIQKKKELYEKKQQESVKRDKETRLENTHRSGLSVRKESVLNIPVDERLEMTRPTLDIPETISNQDNAVPERGERMKGASDVQLLPTEKCNAMGWSLNVKESQKAFKTMDLHVATVNEELPQDKQVMSFKDSDKPHDFEEYHCNTVLVDTLSEQSSLEDDKLTEKAPAIDMYNVIKSDNEKELPSISLPVDIDDKTRDAHTINNKSDEKSHHLTEEISQPCPEHVKLGEDIHFALKIARPDVITDLTTENETKEQKNDKKSTNKKDSDPLQSVDKITHESDPHLSTNQLHVTDAEQQPRLSAEEIRKTIEADIISTTSSPPRVVKFEQEPCVLFYDNSEAVSVDIRTQSRELPMAKRAGQESLMNVPMPVTPDSSIAIETIQEDSHEKVSEYSDRGLSGKDLTYSIDVKKNSDSLQSNDVQEIRQNNADKKCVSNVRSSNKCSGQERGANNTTSDNESRDIRAYFLNDCCEQNISNVILVKDETRAFFSVQCKGIPKIVVENTDAGFSKALSSSGTELGLLNTSPLREAGEVVNYTNVSDENKSKDILQESFKSGVKKAGSNEHFTSHCEVISEEAHRRPSGRRSPGFKENLSSEERNKQQIDKRLAGTDEIAQNRSGVSDRKGSHKVMSPETSPRYEYRTLVAKNDSQSPVSPPILCLFSNCLTATSESTQWERRWDTANYPNVATSWKSDSPSPMHSSNINQTRYENVGSCHVDVKPMTNQETLITIEEIPGDEPSNRTSCTDWIGTTVEAHIPEQKEVPFCNIFHEPNQPTHTSSHNQIFFAHSYHYIDQFKLGAQSDSCNQPSLQTYAQNPGQTSMLTGTPRMTVVDMNRVHSPVMNPGERFADTYQAKASDQPLERSCCDMPTEAPLDAYQVCNDNATSEMCSTMESTSVSHGHDWEIHDDVERSEKSLNMRNPNIVDRSKCIHYVNPIIHSSPANQHFVPQIDMFYANGQQVNRVHPNNVHTYRTKDKKSQGSVEQFRLQSVDPVGVPRNQPNVPVAHSNVAEAFRITYQENKDNSASLSSNRSNAIPSFGLQASRDNTVDYGRFPTGNLSRQDALNWHGGQEHASLGVDMCNILIRPVDTGQLHMGQPNFPGSEQTNQIDLYSQHNNLVNMVNPKCVRYSVADGRVVTNAMNSRSNSISEAEMRQGNDMGSLSQRFQTTRNLLNECESKASEALANHLDDRDTQVFRAERNEPGSTPTNYLEPVANSDACSYQHDQTSPKSIHYNSTDQMNSASAHISHLNLTDILTNHNHDSSSFGNEPINIVHIGSMNNLKVVPNQEIQTNSLLPIFPVNEVDKISTRYIVNNIDQTIFSESKQTGTANLHSSENDSGNGPGITMSLSYSDKMSNVRVHPDVSAQNDQKWLATFIHGSSNQMCHLAPKVAHSSSMEMSQSTCANHETPPENIEKIMNVDNTYGDISDNMYIKAKHQTNDTDIRSKDAHIGLTNEENFGKAECEQTKHVDHLSSEDKHIRETTIGGQSSSSQNQAIKLNQLEILEYVKHYFQTNRLSTEFQSLNPMCLVILPQSIGGNTQPNIVTIPSPMEQYNQVYPIGTPSAASSSVFSQEVSQSTGQPSGSIIVQTPDKSDIERKKDIQCQCNPSVFMDKLAQFPDDLEGEEGLFSSSRCVHTKDKNEQIPTPFDANDDCSSSKTRDSEHNIDERIYQASCPVSNDQYLCQIHARDRDERSGIEFTLKTQIKPNAQKHSKEYCLNLSREMSDLDITDSSTEDLVVYYTSTLGDLEAKLSDLEESECHCLLPNSVDAEAPYYDTAETNNTDNEASSFGASVDTPPMSLCSKSPRYTHTHKSPPYTPSLYSQRSSEMSNQDISRLSFKINQQSPVQDSLNKSVIRTPSLSKSDSPAKNYICCQRDNAASLEAQHDDITSIRCDDTSIQDKKPTVYSTSSGKMIEIASQTRLARNAIEKWKLFRCSRASNARDKCQEKHQVGGTRKINIKDFVNLMELHSVHGASKQQKCDKSPVNATQVCQAAKDLSFTDAQVTLIGTGSGTTAGDFLKVETPEQSSSEASASPGKVADLVKLFLGNMSPRDYASQNEEEDRKSKEFRIPQHESPTSANLKIIKEQLYRHSSPQRTLAESSTRKEDALNVERGNSPTNLGSKVACQTKEHQSRFLKHTLSSSQKVSTSSKETLAKSSRASKLDSQTSVISQNVSIRSEPVSSKPRSMPVLASNHYGEVFEKMFQSNLSLVDNNLFRDKSLTRKQGDNAVSANIRNNAVSASIRNKVSMKTDTTNETNMSKKERRMFSKSPLKLKRLMGEDLPRPIPIKRSINEVNREQAEFKNNSPAKGQHVRNPSNTSSPFEQDACESKQSSANPSSQIDDATDASLSSARGLATKFSGAVNNEGMYLYNTYMYLSCSNTASVQGVSESSSDLTIKSTCAVNGEFSSSADEMESGDEMALENRPGSTSVSESFHSCNSVIQ